MFTGRSCWECHPEWLVVSLFTTLFWFYIDGNIKLEIVAICKENRTGEADDKYRGISVIPSPAPGDRWFVSCEPGSQIVDKARC